MRIVSAAIWYKGKAYTGQKHCSIGRQMLLDGACSRPYPSGNAQGFLTDTNEFVNREDALTIAMMAGQVEKGKTVHHSQLFSEDLK